MKKASSKSQIDVQEFTDQLYELANKIDELLDRVGFEDEVDCFEAVRSQILAIAAKL